MLPAFMPPSGSRAWRCWSCPAPQSDDAASSGEEQGCPAQSRPGHLLQALPLAPGGILFIRGSRPSKQQGKTPRPSASVGTKDPLHPLRIGPGLEKPAHPRRSHSAFPGPRALAGATQGRGRKDVGTSGSIAWLAAHVPFGVSPGYPPQEEDKAPAPHPAPGSATAQSSAPKQIPSPVPACFSFHPRLHPEPQGQQLSGSLC